MAVEGLEHIGDIRASARGVRTAGQAAAHSSSRYAAFAQAVGARATRVGAPERPPEQVLADPASFDIFSPNIALHMAFASAQAPAAEPARAAAAPAQRPQPERMTIVRANERTVERSATIRTLTTRLVRQFLRVERQVPRPDGRGEVVRAATPSSATLERARPTDRRPDMVVRRVPAVPSAPPVEVAVQRDIGAPLRPAAPGQPGLSASEINRVTSEVIATLNRQATAWRERMGRI
jgi:hypothetical protein